MPILRWHWVGRGREDDKETNGWSQNKWTKCVQNRGVLNQHKALAHTFSLWSLFGWRGGDLIAKMSKRYLVWTALGAGRGSASSSSAETSAESLRLLHSTHFIRSNEKNSLWETMSHSLKMPTITTTNTWLFYWTFVKFKMNRMKMLLFDSNFIISMTNFNPPHPLQKKNKYTTLLSNRGRPSYCILKNLNLNWCHV